MPFKKGQSGNPAGKKPGSKDKRWAKIGTFWDMMMEDWNKLTPADRTRYAFECFKLHFDRAMANIPMDQDESLENAINAQALLKSLESNDPESAPTTNSH